MKYYQPTNTSLQAPVKSRKLLKESKSGIMDRTFYDIHIPLPVYQCVCVPAMDFLQVIQDMKN